MIHGIPPEELAMFQQAAEQDEKHDAKVRSLGSIPLGTLVDLSKAAPTQCRRFVREILCRLAIEQTALNNAEISSHAQDCMMTRKKLHEALGEITENYYKSLEPKTRMRFAAGGMTEKEARSFLNVLLTLPESEDDSEGDDDE